MGFSLFGRSISLVSGIGQRYIQRETEAVGTTIEEPYMQIQAVRYVKGMYHMRVFPSSFAGFIRALRYLISV